MILPAAGLKQTFIHHVRFHDDGRYSITDDARQLEWSAGIARIGMSVRRSSGRRRGLITVAAESLGLDSRRGDAERFGVGVAVVAGLGAAVILVVLIVAALLGLF
ncbi:hypothetical protein BH24ACT15_BH24ACT15_25240 [soil metagenome]